MSDSSMLTEKYGADTQAVIDWLVGQTCFYVEDIEGLQVPLDLKVPASHQDTDLEYVYVITSAENKGTSKIGRSRDPEKRLKNLQTGSPYKLYVAHTYGPLIKQSSLDLERRVHKLLGFDHLSGEWFSVGEDDADHVIQGVLDNATIQGALTDA